MGAILKSKDENIAKNDFKEDGYILLKDIIPKDVSQSAAKWLRGRDQEKLAKTWTDQEPGVPLAVYQCVHQDSSPISKIANDKNMLEIASILMSEKVYIWSSKVNMKAAWCGTVEYYHQDYVYWKDRGYKNINMMTCIVFLDPHSPKNGGLHVFPGSHKKGFIEHQQFININGLSKYTIQPMQLNDLYKECGLKGIEAEPGDVLFFHAGLVHGSSHNITEEPRMIILSQLNTQKNMPINVKKLAKEFNLKRAKIELDEAERRLKWFSNKYEMQLKADDVTFNAPIPDEEKNNN